MNFVSRLERLKLWNEVEVGQKDIRPSGGASPDTPSCSSSCFAVHQRLEAPSSTSPSRPTSAELSVQTVVIALGLQSPSHSTAGAASTELVLHVTLTGDESSSVLRRLRLRVPGHDCASQGSFRQVLLNATGRGLLLFSPLCLAVAALPEEVFDSFPGGTSTFVECGDAVPLHPPSGSSFVKASWHPLSDVHVGLLLSNSNWQLLNLAHRASLADPEVQLNVEFGPVQEGPDPAVDFAFAWQDQLAAPSLDAAWLSMSVLFLSQRGRLVACGPILPSVAALPQKVVSLLQSSVGGAHLRPPQTDDADSYVMPPQGESSLEVWQHEALHEWLRATLLRPGSQSQIPEEGLRHGCVRCSHKLHLHGNSASYRTHWLPAQQQLAEERGADTEAPRSPRHQRRFCSLRLLSHSPVAVVARATASGLVELLVLREGIRPLFRGPSGASKPIQCAVFEEIDLALNPSKQVHVELCSSPPVCGPVGHTFLVRSPSLIAAVSVSWLDALCKGSTGSTDELAPSTVVTLAELSGADGPGEIAGWHLFPSESGWAAFWLRASPKPLVPGSSRASSTASSQKPVGLSIDITAVLRAAVQKTKAGARTTKSPGTVVASGEKEECLRHLAAPVLVSGSIFGPASWSAGSRQEAVTAEAAAVALSDVHKGQLASLVSKQVLLQQVAANLPDQAALARTELRALKADSEELKEACKAAAEQAKMLKERQARLVERQERVLSALKDEMELRGLEKAYSSQLPKLWASFHKLRQATEVLCAAAAVPSLAATPGAPVGRGVLSQRLAVVEELQRAWTGVTGEQLRSTLSAAESAVDTALGSPE